MLGVFSCGIISHSPKGSTCFKLSVSGQRSNKPLSHGWKEGAKQHDTAAWPGRGARVLCWGQKSWTFCVRGPSWVTLGCPWHTALQGGHLQPTLLRGLSQLTQRSGPLAPILTPRTITRTTHCPHVTPSRTRHPQQDCADGAGHSKAHTRAHPCCSWPRQWLCVGPGRETWAPTAAASHAPNERCFSPSHYTGFLIKTERAFFSENEPQGPNQWNTLTFQLSAPLPWN